MNTAELSRYENKVEASLFRIKSDYVFLSSSQVIDLPEEREKCLPSNEGTQVSG